MLCACGVNIVTTVEGVIPLVGALLGIAGCVGETLLPAESSLIQIGVSVTQNGLKALASTLKSYDANKTAPGSFAVVQAAFNAVHDNIAQLLSAAQVKDPLTAQKLTGAVNGIVSVLSTVELYLVTKRPEPTDSNTSIGG
jgi:hypothetical protein